MAQSKEIIATRKRELVERIDKSRKEIDQVGGKITSALKTPRNALHAARHLQRPDQNSLLYLGIAGLGSAITAKVLISLFVSKKSSRKRNILRTAIIWTLKPYLKAWATKSVLNFIKTKTRGESSLHSTLGPLEKL